MRLSKDTIKNMIIMNIVDNSTVVIDDFDQEIRTLNEEQFSELVETLIKNCENIQEFLRNNKIYKEIEEWFMKLFNLSIQKQENNAIYFYYNMFYYNEDYIKKYKIAVAFGLEKPKYIFNKDDIIFEQNLRNRWFWFKYKGYWSFLELKYSLNFKDVKEITTNILIKNTNLKQYTTLHKHWVD